MMVMTSRNTFEHAGNVLLSLPCTRQMATELLKWLVQTKSDWNTEME